MKSNITNKYRIVKNGLNEFAVQMKKGRDWAFRVTGLQAEILKFPTKQGSKKIGNQHETFIFSREI